MPISIFFSKQSKFASVTVFPHNAFQAHRENDFPPPTTRPPPQMVGRGLDIFDQLRLLRNPCSDGSKSDQAVNLEIKLSAIGGRLRAC